MEKVVQCISCMVHEVPWLVWSLRQLCNVLLLSPFYRWIKWDSRGCGTSLVAHWLRICLPVQGTRVQALVQEDPTCHWATKPVHRNYWACALELTSHKYRARAPQLLKPTCPRARVPQLLGPCTATTEPVCCKYWTEAQAPRACALQQEKPPKWEARALQWRIAPAHCNKDPTQPKIK